MCDQRRSKEEFEQPSQLIGCAERCAERCAETYGKVKVEKNDLVDRFVDFRRMMRAKKSSRKAPDLAPGIHSNLHRQ